VRNSTILGLLSVVVMLSGCAQVISGDSQDVTVDSAPHTGAQCNLQNGRGSWWVKATPATVTVTRSSSPLTVNCQGDDGWKGSASVPSNVSYLGYADAVSLVGGAVDLQSGAAYEYPEKIMVTLAGPTSRTFGAEGGRSIAAPLDPMADRARWQDDNIATRFQTLRVLLDEGLITADEYNTRRGANLGALLRYSMTLPSRDLERAAPPPQQLVSRLRYLAAAYAEHSITAGEQAAERSTILDGLLPASAIRRADPPPPIKDQLQMAAEIGRIERLLTAHVITSKEADAERAKVHQLLEASVASEEAAARAAAGVTAVSLTSVPSSGVGIALATLPTETQARRIWAGLQKAHPAELANLKLALKKVPRPHRPSYWRITAGPVADYASATALCKILSKQGDVCEATSFTE
jgi:hypothetical protein